MPGVCTWWAIRKPSPTSPNATASPPPVSPLPTISPLLKPRRATASLSPPFCAPSHPPGARPCRLPPIGDPPVRESPRQNPRPPPNPAPSPPSSSLVPAPNNLSEFLRNFRFSLLPHRQKGVCYG